MLRYRRGLLRSARLRARVRNLHRRGYDQRAIAEACGVCQMTVSRWLRKLGLAPNGHGCPRARRKRAETTRLVWAIRRLREARAC